jgi:choline dehydrogenase-like flavoprotein
MPPYLGFSGGNGTCQDGYDDKHPATGAFGSRTWLAGQAVKPNGLLGIAMARPDLYGPDLDAFLRKASTHFGNMTVMCEETSVPENRIELDNGQKDAFGMPVAKVTNTLPDENAKRLDLAREEGLRIFRAANVSEVWTSPRSPMHILGGTVMGNDPSTSMTNDFGQTHEIDNLFIAGASLFPTCGAVNPTATLVALVLRTADFIRENISSLKT